MNGTRRKFLLGAGAAGMAAAFGPRAHASAHARRFKFVHLDVFTAQPLAGNPLDVFLDARGLSDAEMLQVPPTFGAVHDAATGSAAGCAAAWLVRYGVAAPEQSRHIRQGVELKRTSDIFVRANREGEKVVNMRVGGHAVKTMQGELSL